MGKYKSPESQKFLSIWKWSANESTTTVVYCWLYRDGKNPVNSLGEIPAAIKHAIYWWSTIKPNIIKWASASAFSITFHLSDLHFHQLTHTIPFRSADFYWLFGTSSPHTVISQRYKKKKKEKWAITLRSKLQNRQQNWTQCNKEMECESVWGISKQHAIQYTKM